MPVPVDRLEYVSIPEDKIGGIFIPAGAIFSLEKDVSQLGKQTSFLSVIVVAVIVVLFIGFVSVLVALSGILTDAWRYNVNSYIDYQNSDRQTAQKFNDFEMRLQQIVDQVSAIKESRDSLKK